MSSNRVVPAIIDPSSLLKHDFERLAPSKSAVRRGYVFVPKGDIYVTRHCRDLTNKSEKILYVVYNEENGQRLGLRCPKNVFAEVTRKAASTADVRQSVVLAKDRKDLDFARATLMRLFPRIPADVAEAVLIHAFKKWSGRVGRTTTLKNDEKVTLAVVAHARHKFTSYDDRLRELRRDGKLGPSARQLARKAIELKLRQTLREWRRAPRPYKSPVITIPKITECPKPTTSTRDAEPSKSSITNIAKVAESPKHTTNIQGAKSRKKNPKSQRTAEQLANRFAKKLERRIAQKAHDLEQSLKSKSKRCVKRLAKQRKRHEQRMARDAKDSEHKVTTDSYTRRTPVRKAAELARQKIRGARGR